MALNTMIQKLVDARKAYDAQLAELGKTGAEAVAAHLSPHIPMGYFLTWTQGTSSFNDGDPCTFGAGDPYLVPLKSTTTTTACTCGHSVKEHGEGDEFPGSTACQTCEDDTDGVGECDAFEADESEEYEAEERSDVLCIDMYTLNSYGQQHDTRGTRPDGTTFGNVYAARPEFPGLPRDTVCKLAVAWDELPEDLLKQTFGDDARPRVNADGTHSIAEWDCGY